MSYEFILVFNSFIAYSYVPVYTMGSATRVEGWGAGGGFGPSNFWEFLAKSMVTYALGRQFLALNCTLAPLPLYSLADPLIYTYRYVLSITRASDRLCVLSVCVRIWDDKEWQVTLLVNAGRSAISFESTKLKMPRRWNIRPYTSGHAVVPFKWPLLKLRLL